MLKIIPLVIFPLSFFIIFLGVKNLTENSLENVNEKPQLVLLEENDLDKKELTNNEKNINVDSESDIQIIDDSISKIKKKIANDNLEKLKNKKSIDQAVNLKNNKIVDNSTKKKIIKDDLDIEKSGILLQFGVFSKEKNATDLKKKIEKKIIDKFSDFKININYDEKRKFYKLIYKADDKIKAKDICELSNKSNIKCILLKNN